MIALRLTLAILLLAGVTAAKSAYETIAPADFVTRAESYEGRLVSITAQVVSVNADGKSFRLFDPESKAMIDVSLARFTKQQRRDVTHNPVRWVSVNGQAVSVDGKLVIEAHQVVARNR